MHLSKNNNRDYGFEQSLLYHLKLVMQRIWKRCEVLLEKVLSAKPAGVPK